MADAHPAASHNLPSFITAPGETDVLMVVMAIILLLAVLGFGILFLRLHSLPERLAHRRHKLQFEIVAVLCLLALFTHIHIFWVAALLLALIDLPDFTTPLNRIAGSAEKIAGVKPDEPEGPPEGIVPGPGTSQDAGAAKPEVAPATQKEPAHA
jgi:NADH:ubiquinone oxidoreductase subunit 5 (subunit L)/multisubunit Na+/H+ antiporter MnhA subunit